MTNVEEKIINVIWVKAKNGRLFERYEVECQQCGKKDVIPKGRLKRYKYCSKECKMKALNPISERIKYNCMYCNKECESTPFKYNRSKDHFCSQECANNYRSEINSIYNKCEICGEWYKVILSMSHQRFCSIQ